MRIELKKLDETEIPSGDSKIYFHLNQKINDCITSGRRQEWSCSSIFVSIKKAVINFLRWIFPCFFPKKTVQISPDKLVFRHEKKGDFLNITQLTIKDDSVYEDLSDILNKELEKEDIKKFGTQDLDIASILWEAGYRTDGKIDYNPSGTDQTNQAIQKIIEKVKPKRNDIAETYQKALQRIENPEKKEGSLLGDFTMILSQSERHEIYLSDLLALKEIIEDEDVRLGMGNKSFIFTAPTKLD